jgi:CheY-like chemotaxis protein
MQGRKFMARDPQWAVGKTILIVEDDESNAELLRLAIESETSYQVLLIRSAIEAMRRIHEVKAIKPALLLMDYHLSPMTALELYDQLYREAELQYIPAIIITADILNSETENAIKARNMAVLRKPFELDELFHCIEELVRSNSLLPCDNYVVLPDQLA